jgi:DNA-binding GntR family transcriptional regulator
LKLSDYKRYVAIDERLSIPLEDQLTENLSRQIFNRSLFLDEELPHPELLAESLNIEPAVVVRAYNNLIENGLAELEGHYKVTYNDFIYDYYAQRLPIIEALSQQGYTVNLKTFDAVPLSPGDLSLLNIKMPFEKVNEKRIDYLANKYLFAITMNYIPVDAIADIDAFMKTNDSIGKGLKSITSTLTPKGSYQAVTYPPEIAKAFKVPQGRAGLKISYDYFGDNGTLVYAYRAYFTSWMNVSFNHDLNTLAIIPPAVIKEDA